MLALRRNQVKTALWDDVRQQLFSGKPICLFDFADREGETDVMYIGQAVDACGIDFLRRQVGGPLAVYLSGQFLNRLGIVPFPQLINNAHINGTLGRLVQQHRGHDPRFAISVDARDNYTGCSPIEGAHTIQILYDLVCKFDQMTHKELSLAFSNRLVSPGHIPLICGAERLLQERKGHTELSLTIAQMYDLPKIIVAGELIDPTTLKSMRREAAYIFARQHNMPFVTGDEVLTVINKSRD